jgi:predicted transcriptional regulator
MRPPSKTLTTQELEIMKIVWELGTASVRDVYESLRTRRKVAYTTVQTMMRVLERKGHVERRREVRTDLYTATRPQQQVLGRMVREFVDRVFNGAAHPLVLHLVRDRRLSKKELQELSRLVQDSE